MIESEEFYKLEKEKLSLENNTLKQQYPFPGKHDTKKLLEWFNLVKFMPASTRAKLAGMKYMAYRRLEISTGFRIPQTNKFKSYRTPKKIRDLQLKEEWKDKEYITELLKTYNIQDIAKAANRSRKIVYDFINKHNIKTKSNRVINPCSSFKWCYYHYYQKKLTISQCAALANTTPTTFKVWLAKNDIQVRPLVGYKNTRIAKPWMFVLNKKLKDIPVISNVVINEESITVRYKCPLERFYPSIESYYFNKIDHNRTTKRKYLMTIEDSIINNIPPIRYQFGEVSDINTVNKNDSMIMIAREDLKKATLIETRIALHNLMYAIMSRGWVNPSYPKEVIDEIYDTLKNHDLLTHYRNDRIQSKVHPRITKMYRRFIYHFFDMHRAWRLMRKPIRIRHAVDQICKGYDDISYENIIKEILKVKFPRLVPPTMYAALFQKLNVKSLLDLTPGYGSKAIACAILGIKYIPRRSHAIAKAFENGMAEYLKLDYEWFDPSTNDKYDLVMSMDTFSTNMTELLEHKKYAKHVITFVRKHNKDHMAAVYNPSYIVPMVLQINEEIDYIFVW